MSDWLIWQLADSAFPAGSFAHSGGLEAAWQQGQVARGPTLNAFLQSALTQAARASAPFVQAGWKSPGRFTELDQLCDAATPNHVANRASRLQGQSMLASACRIFGLPDLASFQADCRRQSAPMHLAPVLGVIGQSLQISKPQALRLFIFCSLRGMISAAVRLGIIGPMEGQAVQLSMAALAETLVESVVTMQLDDVAQTAPFLDLLQCNQDRLYSRLFQS